MAIQTGRLGIFLYIFNSLPKPNVNVFGWHTSKIYLHGYEIMDKFNANQYGLDQNVTLSFQMGKVQFVPQTITKV